MRIRNVSCTQFAGVRDRSVSFCDGLNVIYGKNESGKSTLVNLISRTLFQDAKLDRRKDKEFFERYFPAAKKGASGAGDFIDGKITMEDENGTYTLSKEWGADFRCTLSTPDGVIRDENRIAGILKQVLGYGEGVYADLLLSSQNHTDAALRTILDAAGKGEAKQELANVISQAFAEGNGISADAIEQAIQAKIEEIAGKHWDTDRQIPVRKAGRWATGLGEILKAYYAVEDARNAVAALSQLEAEVERASAAYTETDLAVTDAQEDYDHFRTFAGRLAVRSERQKAMDRIGRELSRITDVLSRWPRMQSDLEQARALQAEKESRGLLNRFEAALQIHTELETLQAFLTDRRCPADEEIRQVRTAQRSITQLENRLCGMNLQAAIHMLDGHRVEIVSLRTGQPVEASSITEAVKITVPGVMEMQLAPSDVDVEAVEGNIAFHQAAISKIFDAYQVTTLQELEQLEKDLSAARLKAESAQNKLSMLLDGAAFAELEEATNRITGQPRFMEQIESDLCLLCGSRDASKYVTAHETVIAGYEAEYGSIHELEIRALDLETELKKAKEAAILPQDIPAEYLAVSDPEDHLELLERTLKQKQLLRENALTAKTAAISRLEGCREQSEVDPMGELERAECHFTRQKELLHHWLHIAEVFRSVQEALCGNPMQGLADRFAHYLNLISHDGVLSEFPDGDKLNIRLYSRDNKLLDYGKLSEGTKETVSLAFRLAVLDHLFPDGGVIVLDDPFTDMDAERTEQACRMIMDCAQRHQVIFLTCKEDYFEALKGNLIRF